MLSPVHLRTLVTVIRTGSFADAARELGYTSSAVSQQVAALEKSVRTPLFERSAHSVRPTPQATVLAEHALATLASLRALQDVAAEAASGERGAVRVGSFATASGRLLPPAIRAFRQARPLVELHLDEGEIDQLVLQLREGGLDLALVYDYDLVPSRGTPGLRRTPVIDEDLLLLVPVGDPLADATHLALEDLAQRTWIAARPGTPGAECLERACAAAGFVPDVAFRSNNYDVVREFVRGEVGIAMVPALGHQPVSGVLARPMPGAPLRRHVHAIHRAEGLTPAAAAFLPALTTAAELVSGNFLHLPGGPR